MSKLVRLDHVGIIAETWAQASDVLERQMGLPLDTDITKLENGIESLLFEPEQTYNYFVKIGIGETRIEVLIPKPGSETGTTRRLARFGPGLHHLGYGCRDVQAAARELEERGLKRIDLGPISAAFFYPKSAGGILTELVPLRE
jgi:catechol 2,3-dioxygenase-like lactoylglutathione lyase family enzyme